MIDLKSFCRTALHTILSEEVLRSESRRSFALVLSLTFRIAITHSQAEYWNARLGSNEGNYHTP